VVDGAAPVTVFRGLLASLPSVTSYLSFKRFSMLRVVSDDVCIEVYVFFQFAMLCVLLNSNLSIHCLFLLNDLG
jgi:hypothetical protein